MSILKNPVGTVNIHYDKVIHKSKNLDYILVSNDEKNILCLGSKVSDITDMICSNNLITNIMTIKGVGIYEHMYLKTLLDTHNIDKDTIYYILGYKTKEDNSDFICFVFDDIEDCATFQSTISMLNMTMFKTYWENQDDNNN